MCDKYILEGPKPIIPVACNSLGLQFYESLMKLQNLPVAFIDALTEERISYSLFLNITCRLAQSLRNYGIGQNDVIGICSENNINYFCPVVSSLYLGAIVTTFNSSYKPREVVHCGNISKPVIIFCSQRTLNTVLEAKKQMKYVRKVILLTEIENNNYQCDTETMNDFINRNLNQDYSTETFKPIEVDPFEQLATILYSSGTTGLPKGVMLTHQNINVRNSNTRDPRFYRQFNRSNEYVLAVLPFAHAFGLFSTFLLLLVGRPIVLLPKFEAGAFLRTVHNYKIKFLQLVPPMVVALLQYSSVDKYDLSHVEEISCASAPLTKKIQETLMKRFNLKFVNQTYGLTETLGVLAMPVEETRLGSCGKVLPYLSAKVTDQNGRILGPCQKGELHFKGGVVMKGYAGSVEETKKAIDENGWFATGDVGFYDGEEFFYIVDRIKELIKYKGFQVAPAELEGLLLTHPKIADVAVIGVPDKISGELPFACVVKQKGENLTVDEVKNFVTEQLSHEKQLRGGVAFVETIPKSTGGKILRNKLREIFLLPNQSKL